MWVYVVRQLVLWGLSGPILTLVPIGIHLGAAWANNKPSVSMPIVCVADGFLYVLILAMTAVTSQVAAHRPVSTFYFMLYAILSAVLYSATLLDGVAPRALGVLQIALVVFLLGVLVPYTTLRVWDAVGSSRIEYEAEKSRLEAEVTR
jgi:hypothetical protein